MDKTLNLVAERLGKLWKVILNVLLTQTWVYIWVFHLVASAVCFLSLLLSSSYCFVFFPPQRVCQSSGAYLSPVDAKSDVKLRYWNRRVWNMKQCYITSSRSEHLCRRKRPMHLRTLSPNTRGDVLQSLVLDDVNHRTAWLHSVLTKCPQLSRNKYAGSNFIASTGISAAELILQ